MSIARKGAGLFDEVLSFGKTAGKQVDINDLTKSLDPTMLLSMRKTIDTKAGAKLAVSQITKNNEIDTVLKKVTTVPGGTKTDIIKFADDFAEKSGMDKALIKSLVDTTDEQFEVLLKMASKNMDPQLFKTLTNVADSIAILKRSGGGFLDARWAGTAAEKGTEATMKAADDAAQSLKKLGPDAENLPVDKIDPNKLPDALQDQIRKGKKLRKVDTDADKAVREAAAKGPGPPPPLPPAGIPDDQTIKNVVQTGMESELAAATFKGKGPGLVANALAGATKFSADTADKVKKRAVKFKDRKLGAKIAIVLGLGTATIAVIASIGLIAWAVGNTIENALSDDEPVDTRTPQQRLVDTLEGIYTAIIDGELTLDDGIEFMEGWIAEAKEVGIELGPIWQTRLDELKRMRDVVGDNYDDIASGKKTLKQVYREIIQGGGVGNPVVEPTQTWMPQTLMPQNWFIVFFAFMFGLAIIGILIYIATKESPTPAPIAPPPPPSNPYSFF